jgi:excisionase family DNA binding protein
MQQQNWHPAVAAAQGRQKERLLETHQAAPLLKCSRRTVTRRCQNKDLRGIKIGPRKWLIPESAIDEYLEIHNQE